MRGLPSIDLRMSACLISSIELPARFHEAENKDMVLHPVIHKAGTVVVYSAV